MEQISNEKKQFNSTFTNFFSLYFLLLLTHLSLVSSATVSLLITKPYINVQYMGCSPSDTTNCYLVNFKFNNSIVSTGGGKYQITNTSFPVILRLLNVGPSDAGTYQCKFKCSGVDVSSDAVYLPYAYPVTFSTPNNMIYYEYVGHDVTLFCNVINHVELQWQLTDNTVLISNNKYQYQGTNLKISSLQLSDERTYRCVVEDPLNLSFEINAILKVYMKPVIKVSDNTTVLVYEGNSTSFTCTATGSPRPNIIWSRTGNKGTLGIGGRIQKTEVEVDQYTLRSTLTINHVQLGDNGTYQCIASTVNATRFSTFRLDVYVPPTPFFSLYSIDISYSSVNISWILSNVEDDTSLTISWRLASNPGDVVSPLLGQQTISNSVSTFFISSLSSNTSYVISGQILGMNLSHFMTITTEQLEPSPSSSLILTTSLPINDKISSSTYILTRSSSYTSSSFLKPTRPLPVSSTRNYRKSTSDIKLEPTVGRSEPTTESTVSVGIAVGTVALVIIVLVIIFVTVVMVYLAKKGRSDGKLNVQSVDRQNSIRSNDNLINYRNDPKLYPNSSGASLNSISSLPNGGPLSPPSHMDPPKMTDNPKFMIGGLHLSQTNDSIHGCSTCPPPPYSHTQQNIYTIESPQSDYGDFEMTDNPYYQYDTVVINGLPLSPKDQLSQPTNMLDYGTGSQVHLLSQTSALSMDQLRSQSNHEDQSFEFTTNNIYESCTPSQKQEEPLQISQFRHQASHSSGMSLSRTDSPRFEIRSGRRGDVRERVDLVRQT